MDDRPPTFSTKMGNKDWTFDWRIHMCIIVIVAMLAFVLQYIWIYSPWATANPALTGESLGKERSNVTGFESTGPLSMATSCPARFPQSPPNTVTATLTREEEIDAILADIIPRFRECILDVANRMETRSPASIRSILETFLRREIESCIQ